MVVPIVESTHHCFIPISLSLQVIAETNMSHESALEEVFSPFLMQLEKARRLPLESHDEDSSVSDISVLFENIDNRVREVVNILQSIKMGT